MSQIEPKCCPCCGGAARKVYPVDFAGIECAVCGLETKLYQNMNDAVAAWNTRSLPSGVMVDLPPLPEELYEHYPSMSAQSHEAAVKAYARSAIGGNHG